MAQGKFVVVQPEERRPGGSRFAGTQRHLIVDATTPTQRLLTGVIELLEPGCVIPLHYHSSAEEFQYVVSGSGIVWDAHGAAHPIAAGSSVYCGPGPDAAHGFQNTGREPLAILFVYTTEGGGFPDLHLVNPRPPAEAAAPPA